MIILWCLLDNLLEVKKKFKLVIDDPLGSTQIQGLVGHDERLNVQEYTRTYLQNKELGLIHENELEDETGVRNDGFEVENPIFGVVNGDIIVPNEGTLESKVEENIEEKINNLVVLIKEAKKVVIFTGAGVSTESGIPAFRGNDINSVWNKHDITEAGYYDRFLQSEEARQLYWKMCNEIHEHILKAAPNPSHKLPVWLDKNNKLVAVITQNIDGLHLKFDIGRNKVIELHGTDCEAICVKCKKISDREVAHQKILNGAKAVYCDECGAPVKPNTVSFGQGLDHEKLNNAINAVTDCDLLIVMGSSLSVSPANTLPRIAQKRGVNVVLINLEPTTFDPLATMTISAKCGEVVSKVLSQLNSL